MQRLTEQTEAEFRRELERLIAAGDALTDDARRALLLRFDELHSTLRNQAINNEAWMADLDSILSDIDDIVLQAANDIQQLGLDAHQQAWIAGESRTISLLEIGAGIPGQPAPSPGFLILPPARPVVLEAVMRQFTFDRIVTVTTEMQAAIRGQVIAAWVGQQSSFVAMQNITNIIGIRSLPGFRELGTTGISAKSERIFRTELMGAQNMAAQDKLLGELGKFPDLKKIWLCVSGETRVSGVGITHIARRWHTGPVAELYTVSGRVVTVTADHLILTRRGWIAAQDIHPGDDLLSHKRGIERSRPATGGVPHVDDVPPTVAEIFDALHDPASDRGMVRRVVNFDGEGRQSDIDVIAVDSELRRYLEPEGSEGIRQLMLECTDMSLNSLFGECSSREGFLGSWPFPARSENSQFAFPGLVGLLAGTQDSSFRLGADALANEPQALHDAGTGTAILAREDEDRQPLPVFLGYDRCLSVKVFSSSRHVYDYTTATGWMIANGLIVHNSTGDDRTRDEHITAHGQVVPADGFFIVGGEQAQYPLDPGLSIRMRVNCRCASVPYRESWGPVDELIGPLNTEIEAEKARRAAEHYRVHYDGWRILMGTRRSRVAERLRVAG